MKSVILLGYAWSKNEIDWNTKDEIWIMNDMFLKVHRYDVLFELHDDKNLAERDVVKDLKNIKDLEKTIYMQKRNSNIPCSYEYPLESIKNNFYIPAMGDKIFTTCTVSYMLALAIMRNFEKITLLGIDEAIDGEYKDEMPSVLYWLGVAFGRGIEVNISSHSPLLKAYYLYGYESKEKNKFNEFLIKENARLEEIRKNAELIQQKYKDEENKCIGAMTVLEHIKKLTNEI
jgi:hypothetical protein